MEFVKVFWYLYMGGNSSYLISEACSELFDQVKLTIENDTADRVQSEKCIVPSERNFI